jgi:hypothetical protein
MLGPQLFNITADGRGGTCALGSALVAVGVVGTYTNAFEHFPLSRKPAIHPTRSVDRPWLMLSVMRDLNDEYRWSREQIADWVGTIEEQHQTPAEQPQPVAVNT